jgi:lipid II:glycine glycyltransferase (peptidoglycan interpeptide bridge formation enzyme)
MLLKQIDSKDLWEEFLLAHCPQALFQSWEWGEVQKMAGQSVHRFGFYKNSVLLGIAQVFVVKARRGTFLHVRHGPVWKENTISNWRELITLLAPLAHSEKAWFIRMSPLIENSDEISKQFLSLGFRPAPIHAMDAEYCWVLDIDKSEDELLADMRKTTRYEIRHAQKLGIGILSTTGKNKLKDFYALYDETAKRHGFVQHQGLEEEFEVFGREKKALLYLATYNRQTIAGSIILFYGNQAIYHHGASITSKIPASYLIQWEAIREAKKRGITLYNFWGIAPEESPKHPWRGITLFKKGFGGRIVNYIHAQDFAYSPLYIIPKSIETVRRKLRGY